MLSKFFFAPMKDDAMSTITTVSELEKNTAKTTLFSLININRSKVRSLLKAISYRFLGTIATVIISYILTKEVSISLSIGALELVGKIVLFYLHERLWEKIV